MSIKQFISRPRPPYSKNDMIFLGLTAALLVGLPLFVRIISQDTNLTGRAAGLTAIEAENGTTAGQVAVVSDTAASGGKYITLGTATAGQTFVHPGIINSKAQLDFVKAKIAAGNQPWKAAYDKAKAGRYASLSWTPRPVVSVECGNGTSTLSVGCDAQREDATAAYTHALIWYYSGDQAYANKAIQILNAWGGTLTSMPWDGTSKYGNNKLQAGWSGTNFLKAAEIIRYSNAGWAPADITKFETMMKNVYLPITRTGWTGGFNWVTLFADATMNIGIFTNDLDAFNDGLGDYRRVFPQFVYMSGDPMPTSSSWNGATIFSNGLTQETCRDLGHAAMGIASVVHAAETARIQGIDLYGEQSARIRAMLEFQATAARHMEAKQVNSAYVIPNAFCGGTLVQGGSQYKALGEVGYNHYANRMNQSLPETLQFINKYRPMDFSTAGNLHVQYETLTHAATGNL